MSPRGAGAGPVGCQAPQRLRSPSPRPPGAEAAGAAGAAGLRAAGAGSGIPAPQSGHAARGRPGRLFRGRSWGEGGIPCPPPPSLPSPPPPGRPHAALAVLTPGSGRTGLCSSSAAPGGPGIPSVTHGTPLASPGSWGPACVRTSASSCIPALRLPLRAGRAAACGHPVGDPAVVTRDGRIPRVGVFAPPPFWAPPAHGPEAGGELPFPSPRVSSAALRLGDIPRFDDRQLLQGTTSRCRASRFGGGCLLWSRSRPGVCALEWRGGG